MEVVVEGGSQVHQSWMTEIQNTGKSLQIHQQG